MELYGSYTSPFVRHCRIALLEANEGEGQLPCTFVETDAAGSAKLSPTQKVPFLKYKDGGVDKMLTDSSAILKLIREQSGKTFFKDVQEFNTYCAANTLLDTAINLFYLEKENLTSKTTTYLARQQSRMETGMTELNTLKFSTTQPFNDAEIRIACFLDWALFRQRLTLDAYPNLNIFLENIRKYPHFAATVPKG